MNKNFQIATVDYEPPDLAAQLPLPLQLDRTNC
jgi:hypothetical protein